MFVVFFLGFSVAEAASNDLHFQAKLQGILPGLHPEFGGLLVKLLILLR